MQTIGLIGLWLTVKIIKEKYKEATRAQDSSRPA